MKGFFCLEDYSSKIDFSGRDSSWHQKMSELKTDIWVESLIASMFLFATFTSKLLGSIKLLWRDSYIPELLCNRPTTQWTIMRKNYVAIKEKVGIYSARTFN